MPLLGIVDPSHKEYEANVDGRLPYWYTPDELLQESRLWGPKMTPWTHELLAAALGEHQERDYISVTMLTGGCPRSKVLERKEPYIATLDSMYASLRGTLVHRTLEAYARPGSIAEARFFTTVDGAVLSCSPDLITPAGELYDYKVTENPPPFNYPWRGHTLQVQYNAFIVRNHDAWEIGSTGDNRSRGVPDIQSCTLVYMGPKMPKPITVEKKQPFITPKGTEVQRLQPYIWTDEEVLEGERDGEPGLLERLAAMQLALDSYPDFPPEVARVWGGKPDWRCPGKPLCSLPDCAAKRYPDSLAWERD